MKAHNPFFRPQIASNYEAWYQNEGYDADQKEKTLLNWLLGHFDNVSSILEVGCGTGHFTRWLETKDKHVIGLDVSPPMIFTAKELGSKRLCLGEAQTLPFVAGSFDVVIMVTLLEFLDDPLPILREARRISKKGVVLGTINRHSFLGLHKKLKKGPIWGSACLYSISGIRDVLEKAYDDQPRIIWRTTLWPCIPWFLTLPWGGFIGMAIRW